MGVNKKDPFEGITVKADRTDTENLIQAGGGIQSKFRTELREPLLKPSRSSDT